MKSNFKFVCTFILALFAGTAVMSVFLTVMFRDVRRDPMGEYLKDYLWPRFMEFYMIFAPIVLVMSAILLVGWLLYELSREPKSR